MGPLGKTSALKKIAITGSNGSVGRRVVLRALQERGYHVVGIDHSALVTADDRELGSNFSFLQALEGCEAIIHLAAYPRPGDYKVVVHNSNVVISWNILRAAAELGIKRVAQASSVNVITMVYSQAPRFEFFPIDEVTLPASSLVGAAPAPLLRRNLDVARAKNDLWGYVQEDSAAEAFMLAITQPTDSWPSASEAFFIVAPETTFDGNTSELLQEHWPNVPIKEGKGLSGNAGLFDCSKAKRLLGWVHNPSLGTVDA
ncbi:hypothetical protein B0H17DRAFT_1212770 [Mycena rosella]|uniref:NAD-dependent epimerase/dehydratase domain-containing protein n=1 Tax=Mycena rosella TaxID=1033263 RepID=A0AAD7CRY1_MYCRO|nr:hypothetical protein B0H17DRAFT_1212770 [Mycena rosella]